MLYNMMNHVDFHFFYIVNTYGSQYRKTFYYWQPAMLICDIEHTVCISDYLLCNLINYSSERVPGTTHATCEDGSRYAKERKTHVKTGSKPKKTLILKYLNIYV